jgi:hypothetical protein
MRSLKTNIGTKVKQTLGIQPNSVGRKLTVFSDDIFLVSYPKSGNTWIRFLIGNLLYPEVDITFANVQNIIPDIYLASNRELLQISRPRILKSHEYFDPRYKKVILITRDPRDITLSAYFHSIKYGLITKTTSLEEFSQGFLSNHYHFVRQSNPLGSWGENTGSWLGAMEGKDHNNFLLLRYEDFQTDITMQLAKIAKFMNLDCLESDINLAVEKSSFKRMRELERIQQDVWPNKYTRHNIAFVREAVSGQGSLKLPQSAIQQIESLWGNTMKKLGYLEN